MDNQANEDAVYSNQDIPFLYDNFVLEVDELISLAHYGPGLILLIGPEGMGKSKILEQFESELTDAGIIRIDGTPMLSIDQLFASILQQLQALNRIIEFDNTQQAIIEASEDIDQVILVDDARQLSTAVLETLIRLVGPISSNPEHPVRLVLSGEEELISQISELSLVPSNAIFPLHLNGLEQDEVAGFLGHQLNLSRQNVEENYGQKRLNNLWKNSEGNPGKLLKSLHQSDEIEITPDGSRASNWMKPGLIIIGIILLAVAIFGDSWRSSEPALTEENSSGDIVLDIQPAKQMPSTESDKALQLNADDNLANSQQQAESENSTASKQETADNDNMDLLSSKKTETDNPLTQTLTEAVTTEVEAATSDGSEQVDTPAELPSHIPATLAAETTAAQHPAEKVNPVIENTLGDTKYNKDENWLLQQPPHKYMIQFVGLSNLQAMDKFVESYHFPFDIKIYRSRLNDKPWFILVGGLYEDADSARKARDNFSATLKNLQPWVKSVNIIQKEIRQAAGYR